MCAKTSAKKNSRAKVVRVPWEVVAVRALPGFALFVRFADGTEGQVDVKEFLFAPNPGVFEPLRDPVKFSQARVRDGAVTWPGGLDMAPDAMYDDIKATGRRVAGRRPVAR